MANREIEAILRVSSKLGSMTALTTLERKLAQVNRQAVAYNRANDLVDRRGRNAWLAMQRTLSMTAITAGGLGYALERNFAAYAGIERRLNRIAINAGEGKRAVGDMLRVINQSSHDYAMSQEDVTAGLETLIAAGRDADDAMKFLPSVTATAQAAGAEITDIATTADTVATNFDIAGESMQGAFDIMVAGGKQGKFELKDMAQYVPSLAPAFVTVGEKGEKGLAKLVAMLQTIRIRTGDASEAATDLQNVLQKMESQETVTKFKKFGIDLRKEMAAARKDGRDLIDTFLDLSEKATKGDLSKLPQLFTDAQFLAGVRALIQGREELAKFNTELGNVDGATLRDLNQVLSDSQSKIDKMASSWSNFTTQLGTAVAPAASATLDFLTEGMSEADAINTQLEREGYNWAQRRGWWATHGFDTEAQGALAFKAGWRSPEGKLAAQGPMSLSPELPSRRKDKTAVGGGIPVPTPRPEDAALIELPGELRYGRFPAIGKGYVESLQRQEQSDFAAAPKRQQHAVLAQYFSAPTGDQSYDDFAKAAAGGQPEQRQEQADFAAAPKREQHAVLAQYFSAPTGDRSYEIANGARRGSQPDFGSEIADGAERGSRSIADAAQAINQAGQDGGATFADMLRGVGHDTGNDAASAFQAGIAGLGQKLGADIAAAIQRAVANISVSAHVSGGGLPPASGNKGQTMVNAGRNRGEL